MYRHNYVTCKVPSFLTQLHFRSCSRNCKKKTMKNFQFGLLHPDSRNTAKLTAYYISINNGIWLKFLFYVYFLLIMRFNLYINFEMSVWVGTKEILSKYSFCKIRQNTFYNIASICSLYRRRSMNLTITFSTFIVSTYSLSSHSIFHG